MYCNFVSKMLKVLRETLRLLHLLPDETKPTLVDLYKRPKYIYGAVLDIFFLHNRQLFHAMGYLWLGPSPLLWVGGGAFYFGHIELIKLFSSVGWDSADV